MLLAQVTHRFSQIRGIVRDGQELQGHNLILFRWGAISDIYYMFSDDQSPEFHSRFISVNQHSEMSSHTDPTLQDFAKEYLVIIFDTIKGKKIIL